MSGFVQHWPLKLLALLIASTLWAALTARDRRQASATIEVLLRVVPVVLGTPAPGHRVAAVRVDPNVVVVKGPRSTIGTRDTIQTTPVDVAGRRSRVTQQVGLALPAAVSALPEGEGVRVTVDIQAAQSGTALDTEGSAR